MENYGEMQPVACITFAQVNTSVYALHESTKSFTTSIKRIFFKKEVKVRNTTAPEEAWRELPEGR